MFDPVTNEALRLRRLNAEPPAEPEEADRRTRLVCNVCAREIGPEEQVFWVGEEVHCFQCHDMLKYEYDRERKADERMREKGTRWVEGDGD
jgi:hypothetical protein